MNKENNGYVILYASVMVILVAVGLAFTSQSLKDRQIDNQNIDKMEQILRSLGISGVAKDKVIDTYNATITDAYLVDREGNVIEETRGTGTTDPAFSYDIAELRTPAERKSYPVFEATLDGQKAYVMALYGAGLWGPIWGYISVAGDGDNVLGADFSHASETPGLGAEITHEPFSGQFRDKHLYRDGSFTSIAVVKHGKTDESRDYVDGISGGTLTSKGVNNMLLDVLTQYEPFLNNLKQQNN